MCLSLTAAALVSSAAFATEASLPADAPVHLALGSATGARLLSPSEVSATPGGWTVPGYVPHFGLTFAAAFVSIPAGQYLATLFGNLSNNLIGGLIPGALVMGLVAPAIVALVSWLYGNKDYLSATDKPFRFIGPWLITTGVHIVSLIIAGFAGVTVAAPATIFTMAVVDGLVLAGAKVGVMHLLTKAPAVAASSAPSCPASPRPRWSPSPRWPSDGAPHARHCTPPLRAACSRPLALAGPCPTRPSWPTKDWPSQPVDRATKATEVEALEDYAFTLSGKDAAAQGPAHRRPRHRQGRRHRLRALRRAASAPTNKHLSWSVAKSITSALDRRGGGEEARSRSTTPSAPTSPSTRARTSAASRCGHPLTFASGLALAGELRGRSRTR